MSSLCPTPGSVARAPTVVGVTVTSWRANGPPADPLRLLLDDVDITAQHTAVWRTRPQLIAYYRAFDAPLPPARTP